MLRPANLLLPLAVAWTACAEAQTTAARLQVFSRAEMLAPRAQTQIKFPNQGPIVASFPIRTEKAASTVVAERVHFLKAVGAIRDVQKIKRPSGSAQFGQYPWMAAFQVWDSIDQKWLQYCGGTLIAEKVVLSATHCDQFPEASWTFIRVVINVVDLNLATAANSYRIVDVKRHPRFDYVQMKLRDGRDLTGLTYDFALFYLDRAPPVKPVALAKDQTKKDTVAHGLARAMGWGADEKKGATSPYLLYADLPLVDDAECSKSYIPLDKAMLCAGFKDGGSDSCDADSGGPLIVRNATTKALEQVGVISFGEGCGNAGYFGIYSWVTEGRPWIGGEVPSVVAGHSPPERARRSMVARAR